MKNDLDETLLPHLAKLASTAAMVPLNENNATFVRSGVYLSAFPIPGGVPTLVQDAKGSFTYTRVALDVLTAQWGAIRIPAKLYANFEAFRAVVLQYNAINFDVSDLTLTFPLDLTNVNKVELRATDISIRFVGYTNARVF